MYGNIIVTIRIKDPFEAKIKLKLNHSENHAEMSIIKIEFLSVAPLDESPEMVSNLLSSDNEVDYLIGKYAEGSESPPSGDKVLELVKENIYDGISHGCLNNNDLRVGVVDGLHNWRKGLEESSDVYREAHEMISNIIANSTLSDYAVRHKYGKFVFTSDAIFERFFGFFKKDKGKICYFLDAVHSGIGKDATLNYLKKNYESIFENKDYSIALVRNAVHNNREDLFKIIEENQGEEYTSLSIAKVQEFDNTLRNSRNRPHFYSFAERLLDVISKDEVIRNRPCVFFNGSGLERFLQILKKSGDIDKKKQEKLFCYYFYAYNNDDYNQPLEILMKQTCDSPNFPIDFVSDCIVRRPNILSCKVYIALLELILKRNQEKIKLGEDAFAIIKHVIEYIWCDKNKDKVEGDMYPLAQKLSGLLNEVKEKGLIRKICFDKQRLMELASGHLRSICPEIHFKGYVSLVNKLMKESSNK